MPGPRLRGAALGVRRCECFPPPSTCPACPVVPAMPAAWAGWPCWAMPGNCRPGRWWRRTFPYSRVLIVAAERFFCCRGAKQCPMTFQAVRRIREGPLRVGRGRAHGSMSGRTSVISGVHVTSGRRTSTGTLPRNVVEARHDRADRDTVNNGMPGNVAAGRARGAHRRDMMRASAGETGGTEPPSPASAPACCGGKRKRPSGFPTGVSHFWDWGREGGACPDRRACRRFRKARDSPRRPPPVRAGRGGSPPLPRA